MVAGRLVAHRAVGAALVCGLSSTAVAQPAPKPRPAPPPKAGARAEAPLDRQTFPFLPLQMAWSVDTGQNPTGPAATDGTRLLVPFPGSVAIFQLTTGTLLTSRPTPTTLAPVFDQGRVIVTGDSLLDAFRAADTTPLWQAPLAAKASFAPVARSGWVFVALSNGTITALRGDKGSAVWSVPVGVATTAPVVEGDRLYAATAGGVMRALNVTDGAAIWQATLDGDATAVTAVADKVFVATSGRWLYALDGKGQVRWRFRIQGAAIGLAVDEDRVIAVTLDQAVRAFKIGSGAQAWRQELSFRPAGGPIVTGLSVLITGFGPNLRAVDRKTGANQGTYTIPLPVDASGFSLETLASGPVVWNGATMFDDMVVLITQHGLVHAAKRGFDPPATPVTAMPGTVVAVPAPPPGMPAEPAASTSPPAAAPPATASPATAPPATPPAATKPPAAPPGR